MKFCSSPFLFKSVFIGMICKLLLPGVSYKDHIE